MADDGTTTTDGNDAGTTSTGDGFTPITTQDDLNQVIAGRLARERAKYADYDDLAAKAAQVDEVERRAVEAEQAATSAHTDALRWKVAARHGVSADDAELFLTGTDEDTLTRQAERLAVAVSDRRTNSNHVPGEGTTTPPPGPDPVREFTRELFGKGES